jgi:GxxExxY protein
MFTACSDQGSASQSTSAPTVSSWIRAEFHSSANAPSRFGTKEWRIPGQRIDLIVANVVLVEIKTVKHLKQIHTSQVVSYLKTTGLRVGLLINFNGVRLKDGLKRIIL